MGGAAPFHQPSPASRIYGAAGALGVGLLGFQRFCQIAARVEHIGGYRVGRTAIVFLVPRGVVVQAHRRAHGFQQPVQLAGGVQAAQVAYIRLTAENDRAAAFGKRPDFLHKCLVERLRRSGYQQKVAVFRQFPARNVHRYIDPIGNFGQSVQLSRSGIAVGSVYGDVLHLLRDMEAQAQRFFVGAVFPVYAACRYDPKLCHSQFRVGVREGMAQRPHARRCSRVGDRFDQRAVGIKRQGFHEEIHRLIIVQLYRQLDFLVPGRGGRA